MNGMNRRQILRGAGGALTLPLVATLMPAPAYGRGVANGNTASTPPDQTMNPDLGTYIVNGLARELGQYHSGRKDSVDFAVLASHARLMATHCESVNVDASIKTLASSTLQGNYPAVINVASRPELDDAVKLMQQYVPGFTKEDLLSRSSMPQLIEVKPALTQLADSGISKLFHDISDHIANVTPVPAIPFSKVATGTFSRSDAHFEQICGKPLTNKQKAAICMVLSTGTALLTVGIISALCEGVTAGACTVLISAFAYFAYASLLALALGLCTLFVGYELPEAGAPRLYAI